MSRLGDSITTTTTQILADIVDTNILNVKGVGDLAKEPLEQGL